MTFQPIECTLSADKDYEGNITDIGFRSVSIKRDESGKVIMRLNASDAFYVVVEDDNWAGNVHVGDYVKVTLGTDGIVRYE